MLYMEARHEAIVRHILGAYPFTFYAFGSRVKGNPKPFSDLDVCFMEDIPQEVCGHILDNFEESDLPFKVDLIDWRQCGPDFQEHIANDLVCIQPAPSTP